MDSDDIRPLVAADAGELLTLQRAAYATEAQLYRDAFLPALTQTLDEVRQELQSAQALGLRRGQRLIGAVRTKTVGDEIEIGRLTVAPDLQGQGIGTRLLLAAEQLAPQARSAVLFTGHLSTANLRLYERHGYRETHRQPLKPGVELVYLRKEISGP
ncbi:MAG TPA: GNAT family N-acetyltransferase [Amnibacterium sp.]|uniref:GNAT family N-acetyltransferase n=1 Tax=Amnibacterium sp. TaxID=1872496 RepID=UPI002F94F37C